MTVSQLYDLTHYAHETRRLAQDLAASSNAGGSPATGAPPRRIWAALIDSAARVLSEASSALGHALEAEKSPRDVSSEVSQPVGDRLWELTRGLTALTAYGDLPPSLDEAVAALQTSSCVFAEPGSDVTARLTVLRETRPEASGRLRLQPNGPYVGTNIEKLNNWLGEEVAVPPLIALCRCGGSAIKPFCDGAHARNQFSDAKDPKRVADRQDTYRWSAADRARQSRHVRALRLLY